MVLYSALVDQVLKIPLLADRIQQWAEESDSLNLVVADWKERLQSSVMMTDFEGNAKDLFTAERQVGSSPFRVQNVKEGPYQMIVLGVGSVYRQYPGASPKQPFAVTLQDCDPLNMLAEAWTSDVDPEMVELSDSVKLNFGSCSICCRNCQSALKDLKASGVHVKPDLNQPCIVNLEIFDGQALTHCFAPQMKSYFQTKFIAIMHVALNVRYFYAVKGQKKDRVRLGGKAFSMIAFPESNLMASPKLFLSNLPVLEDIGGDERPPSKKTRWDAEEEEEEVIDVMPKPREQVYVVEETIHFD